MFSDIILYGGPVVAMLRGILDVWEIVARQTCRRRIEQEHQLRGRA